MFECFFCLRKHAIPINTILMNVNFSISHCCTHFYLIPFKASKFYQFFYLAVDPHFICFVYETSCNQSCVNWWMLSTLKQKNDKQISCLLPAKSKCKLN